MLPCTHFVHLNMASVEQYFKRKFTFIKSQKIRTGASTCTTILNFLPLQNNCNFHSHSKNVENGHLKILNEFLLNLHAVIADFDRSKPFSGWKKKNNKIMTETFWMKVRKRFKIHYTALLQIWMEKTISLLLLSSTSEVKKLRTQLQDFS